MAITVIFLDLERVIASRSSRGPGGVHSLDLLALARGGGPGRDITCPLLS